MTSPSRFVAQLRQLDWARGLRAGLAVAASMLVCRTLGLPMGWSALGAFEGNIVDNGGPYRSRFASIAMLMLAGSLGAIMASRASYHLALSLVLTAVFAFAVTYLRAAGPPFTSSSVIILVVYFVGLDHPTASLTESLRQAELFLGGCAGAALLSLILWPVYPFRHARRAIGSCYGLLAQSLSEIDAALASRQTTSDVVTQNNAEWKKNWFSLVHSYPSRMRIALEAARRSLGSVRARTPARTARGRNLAVLLETADILLSRTLIVIELAERSTLEGDGSDIAPARRTLAWLRREAELVERALWERTPMETTISEGKHLIAAAGEAAPAYSTAAAAFHAVELECAQIFETVLEALTSVATGIDPVFSIRSGRELPTPESYAKAEQRLRRQSPAMLEILRENWTFTSSAMRHALRTSAVCAASVLLVRLLHLPYGEWMALTAVIVLQPHVAATWRKSIERVGGTIAGGVLAAMLAVFIHTPDRLIVAVCITSFFTLAWFAVDYAWYSFFLTPTFVLLTLHGQHGWNVAGIRAMDTLLGAALALIAVRLLWTEAEHIRLGFILARSADANAAYLAAMRRYWSTPLNNQATADREVLSPARRQAGLANNESEEAHERLMLEGIRTPSASVAAEHALAFTTYSRRLTQSVTAVALLQALGSASDQKWMDFLNNLESRLKQTSKILREENTEPASSQRQFPLPADAEKRYGMRLRRQVDVLETSARGVIQAP